MTTVSKYLARRVEYIRDTSEDSVHDVIITVNNPMPDDEQFTTGLLDTFQRRGIVNSARDLLPVTNKSLRATRSKDKPTRDAAAQKLRNDDHSLTAYLAGTAASTSEAGGQALNSAAVATALRNLVQPVFRRLFASDVVQNAVKAAATSGDPPTGQPLSFWTSSSVVLRIRDDNLKEVVADMVARDIPVQDIFPNQRLALPPVATPKNVPGDILDNKVSSWGLRNIGAMSSWGAFGCRGKDVLVGLLDTGVDPTHPDLKGKIAHWAEFNDLGREVVGSTAHDSDKHGTHCAGTICGGNKSGRWIGVAPKAKLAAGMVLRGSQGGTLAQILAGIQWAIDLQVDVISMSLGTIELASEIPTPYTKALSQALRLGIPVVTSIGNSGSQTTGAPGNDILSLAVGATDHMNRAAGFSGGRTVVIRESQFFSPHHLPLIYSKPELSAPGVAIYSSVPGGSWDYMNGTSMATPHVAGAIALLLSGTNIRAKVPAMQRAGLIQDLLTGSAEELGESGQNHRFGFGRIDILRALGFARSLGY